MKEFNLTTGNVYVAIEGILQAARTALAASSCTFYVRDPFWNDFRLFAETGVRHKEPMHGLLLPVRSRSKISEGPADEWFVDANTWQLHEDYRQPLRDIIAQNPLFGDFVTREDVKSSARLIHHDGSQVVASLFVNFGETTAFDDQLKNKIRDVMKKLLTLFPDVVRALTAEDPFVLRKLVAVLQLTERLSDFFHRPRTSMGDPLKEAFQAILKTVLEAFGIEPHRGFGTIHRYVPETGMLMPYGRIGEVEQEPFPQSMHTGQGVISWVGLRQRALLIEDLNESAFNRDPNRIYVPLKHDIRSELAIPMLVGEELLGVVNLESVEPHAFKPSDLPAVWFAANQAATACHLAQQASDCKDLASRTNRFLAVCHSAATGQSDENGNGDQRSPLDVFAELLCEWNRAELCDIWKWDGNDGRFTHGGASYPGLDGLAGPRCGRSEKDGWSSFVWRHKVPIWISEIKDIDSYRALSWRRNTEEWSNVRSASDAPATLNQRLLDLGVKSEIGFPIEVLDKCVGVAWLKFSEPIREAIAIELVKGAQLIAGNLGLVIDFLQRYAGKLQETERTYERRIESFREKLFPESLLEPIPGLKVAARTFPVGGLMGGDVYGLAREQSKRRRILAFLADGTGHGFAAALEALPLLTAFRIFSETFTPRHVLQKVVEVADDLDVMAPVTCFLVDFESTKPLVSVSSAGGWPLMVIQPDGCNFDVPAVDDPAAPQTIGRGSKEAIAVFEAQHTLNEGDILIAYSDGIPEAHDSNRAQFRRLGILAAALAHIKEEPDRIIEAIYDEARKHSGGTMEDDATLIVMRLEKEAEGTIEVPSSPAH